MFALIHLHCDSRGAAHAWSCSLSNGQLRPKLYSFYHEHAAVAYAGEYACTCIPRIIIIVAKFACTSAGAWINYSKTKVSHFYSPTFINPAWSKCESQVDIDTILTCCQISVNYVIICIPFAKKIRDEKKMLTETSTSLQYSWKKCQHNTCTLAMHVSFDPTKYHCGIRNFQLLYREPVGIIIRIILSESPWVINSTVPSGYLSTPRSD